MPISIPVILYAVIVQPSEEGAASAVVFSILVFSAVIGNGEPSRRITQKGAMDCGLGANHKVLVRSSADPSIPLDIPHL